MVLVAPVVHDLYRSSGTDGYGVDRALSDRRNKIERGRERATHEEAE